MDRTLDRTLDVKALQEDRSMTRRLLAAVQGALDDGVPLTTAALPPLDGLDQGLLDSLPGRLGLDDLPGLRQQLLDRGRQLDEQLQQLRQGTAAAAADPGLDVQALLARLQAMPQLDAGALACSRWQAPLQAALEAKDLDAQVQAAMHGAAACHAAAAAVSCPARTFSWCPMAHAQEHRKGAKAAMKREGDVGAVPRRQAQLVLDHLDWTAARRPLKPTPALDAARAFMARRPGKLVVQGQQLQLDGREWALVFHGPTGLGKTVAAAWMLSRVGGIYLTSYDLLRVGFDPDVPTKDQLRQAPLVVLDQLGREPRGATDHGPGMVEWLVDARYAADRRLVLIGNFSGQDEVAAHYDEVVADRLREGALWVHLSGPSFRGADTPR